MIFNYPEERTNPKYKFNEIISGYNINFKLIEMMLTSSTNSISANSISTITLSSETIYSGSTDIYDIFLTCPKLINCPTIEEIKNDIYFLSANTKDDIYTTEFLYNNSNEFTILNSTGGSLSSTINVVTGLTTNFIQYNTHLSEATEEGKLNWNNQEGTLNLGLKGGNVDLQIGQERLVRIINKIGNDLLKSEYKVVYITGATEQRLTIGLAKTDNESIYFSSLGVVTENIENNLEGFITSFGRIKDINTTGSLQGENWIDGDILYLSPLIAGSITNIKPTAPNKAVIIGYVEYAHATHGKIFVQINNGYELEELYNVNINTKTGGSSLTYNTSTGFWEDKPITWTVELIDALTVDVYAPYNLSIDTIINVLNSPSITIQDDGMSYTLGNPISIGSKITITASSVGVINLIINNL